MKVLHLIDHLGLGGSQSIVLDLLEARDRSNDQHVWTLSDRPLPETARRLSEAGVPHRSLRLSKLDPTALFKVRSLVARERPDVLHTHLDYSNGLGTMAALAAGRPRPGLVTQIENDPGQHYGALARFLLGRLASRVDAHVFVSQSLLESSQSVLRGRCRRMEVIRPAIDLKRFDRSRISAEEIAKLRDGASVVVGSVGRLADQKAYEFLVDATPALLEHDPGTRVVLVGDGPCRDRLVARSRELGVEHAVRFPGYRSDPEVALAAMDVFTLPSRHEGFAVVAIEAMAMEVPVVGTRVVGTVDSVGEDRGVLVPSGDASALASGIVRVLSDPALRARIVAAGREYVRRECDPRAAAARYEALYESLWQASGKSPGADGGP